MHLMLLVSTDLPYEFRKHHRASDERLGELTITLPELFVDLVL